jgi:galactokinase
MGPILSANMPRCATISRSLERCRNGGGQAETHGARMVGGGFGGSVIAPVGRERTATVADAVRNRFARAGFADPHTFVVVQDAGVHRVD